MAVNLPIYMDNHATTPVDPRVLEAMLPYFTEHFGNPHSESHAYGENAMAAINPNSAALRSSSFPLRVFVPLFMTGSFSGVVMAAMTIIT